MADEISKSCLSNASSAPPALNEQLMQDDQHKDKTAEEKELAAAQLRLKELPIGRILSAMQKALPVDAHIDADVDVMMRACVAKFAGVLTKEAKQLRAQARHKVLQPEDIINAVKKLGFEGSFNALSLFHSRYTEATNCSHPWKVQLPVNTSEMISTEIQQQGTVNVPTKNSLEPNIGTHVQSPLHGSDLLPAEMMEMQGGVNVSTENAFRENKGSTHVRWEIHIPTLIAVGPNLGKALQLPMHNVDSFRTEMQWESSGITHVNPTPSLQHEGNATMVPLSSSSLLSGPLSFEQSVPLQLSEVVPNPYLIPYSRNMQPPSVQMQNPGSAQRGPLNLNPPSSYEPFSQLMVHSDARFAQKVPNHIWNAQRNIERYVPNVYGFGDQQPREATGSNAPALTQPINQPAFPGNTQMASHQQSAGGYGTIMAADVILDSEAGSITSIPSNEMMSDADLADTLELLREYGVLSDEPQAGKQGTGA